MSHRNVQPHVSKDEVACYRTERNTDGGTPDTPSRVLGGSVRPSSVLELTKNDEGESSMPLVL